MRRLAYEASDNGLLNPDLAAGIRRVKGAKRLGIRFGNWLTIDQGRRLLAVSSAGSTKDKRDHAILSLLLGCCLRRAELTGLRLSDFQQRDAHWAIVNLFGTGGHIRTVPVPGWVKAVLDAWLHASEIKEGIVFRRVSSSGSVWGPKISEKLVGGLSGSGPASPESREWRRMISDAPALAYAMQQEVSWSRFNSPWGIDR